MGFEILGEISQIETIAVDPTVGDAPGTVWGREMAEDEGHSLGAPAEW